MTSEEGYGYEFDALEEAAWLIKNPHFRERPASVAEFLGPRYLDIDKGIRPAIRDMLVEIIGDEPNPNKPTKFSEAISTGGIGIGKCSRIDDYADYADGTQGYMKDVQVGDKLRGGVVVHSASNGFNPMVEVKSNWGHTLNTTENHPFWVVGKGWVEAAELEPGDEFDVSPWEAEGATEAEPDELFRWLGYMVADGSTTTSSLKYSKLNPTLIADMTHCCAVLGGSLVQGRNAQRHDFRVNGCTPVARAHGLVGHSSHTKRVPEIVMKATNRQIEQFLCAYFESDGHTGPTAAEFYSVNPDLLKDVQLLMLRLGIPAKLKIKNGRYKGEVHKSWRLQVPVAGFLLMRKWDFKEPDHRPREIRPIPESTPERFCGCGCGESTKYNNGTRSNGKIRWAYGKFKRGHANSARPEIVNPKCRVECVSVGEDAESWQVQVEPSNELWMSGIKTHNTTVAAIVLPYLCHWTLCLKDPQGYFDLLPGSRIAFMMMSTKASQAKEVLFSDIKARLSHSPWFKNFKIDKNYRNQIRFDGDIWIVPGDSQETTFEGYNILGGIMDEADCVDESTQILTSQGWKTYDELQVADEVLTLNHDTGKSEWQPCLEVKVFPAAPREVVVMEGREFSSLTTLNHRWPVLRPHNWGEERAWTTSEDFGFRDRILRCAPSELPTEPKWSDALVELVAWFWTEGHDRQGQGKTAWIHQSPVNASNVERIRAALETEFGPAVESFPRQGRSHDYVPRWREDFRVNKDAYWGEIYRFVLSVAAGQKVQEHAPGRVPSHEFLLSLTQHQLELFIEVSMLADNNGPNRLSQKNPASSEAFAFACILSGRAVSIRPRKATNTTPYDMHCVTMAKKKIHTPLVSAYSAARRSPSNGMTVNREVYDGMVWCPRTRNGTWMAKRNGSIYFTGNSHKVTKEKDYARVGLETIQNRISSRFGDRGFLLIIGQMKSSGGFAAQIFEEYTNAPNKYANRMTIWESRGWEFYRDPKTRKIETFFYDVERKQVVPSILAASAERELMEIPMLYRDQFDANPEKALKDLAGIPPKVTDPFISQVYKIKLCSNRWAEKFMPESPVSPNGNVETWFKATNKLPRVAHLDLAFSGDGDACGMAMGHVSHMIDYEGELKPYIVIDFLWRMKAAKGKELVIADIRRVIYDLRDEFGFNLEKVTFDSYSSKDTEQQLRRKRFQVAEVSVDRTLLPYYDLREAIYESRLDFPPYLTKLNPTDGDNDLVEIVVKELEELRDDGRKVDHPAKGSKDVADALAGVVTTLMGSRRYHKTKNTDSIMAPMRDLPTHRLKTPDQVSHPALNRGFERLSSIPAPRL